MYTFGYHEDVPEELALAEAICAAPAEVAGRFQLVNLLGRSVLFPKDANALTLVAAHSLLETLLAQARLFIFVPDSHTGDKDLVAAIRASAYAYRFDIRHCANSDSVLLAPGNIISYKIAAAEHNVSIILAGGRPHTTGVDDLVLTIDASNPKHVRLAARFKCVTGARIQEGCSVMHLWSCDASYKGEQAAEMVIGYVKKNILMLFTTSRTDLRYIITVCVTDKRFLRELEEITTHIRGLVAVVFVEAADAETVSTVDGTVQGVDKWELLDVLRTASRITRH